MKSINRFLRDESGITAAEYGIILGCIVLALVTGLVAFYTQLGDLFSRWSTWFAGKSPPS